MAGDGLLQERVDRLQETESNRRRPRLTEEINSKIGMPEVKGTSEDDRGTWIRVERRRPVKYSHIPW